jgi:isoleucyl-tRNA synthetase
MTFRPVDQRPALPVLERRVLERWRSREVFRRSLERTARGPVFRFYEGPPTANGRPGVHHVEARVFKDLFLRYRTMKGHVVPRKAGWDCHGIPVELEVERELGLTSKTDIEGFGVAEFNERCRESVTRYVGDFERLTERIGYWVDTDGAYRTMSPEYIQSVWWSLKTLFDRGFLYEDDRVVPYCPRCGTALSDHEVAQGYREADDPSIYVRFPVLTGPLAEEDVDLLIWTTMPWTLVPATLAVVGREIRYIVVRGGRAGDRPVVLAAGRMDEALGEGAEIVREVDLPEMVGARYRAPFDFVGPGSVDDPGGDPASWRFVVAADFVKTDEGTGIVHTGAAFGEDDMRVAREHGVPVVKPVDPEGRFDERCGPYAGTFVRDADARIIEGLREAGLLVHAGTHRHTFPFCWRCDTPLLYYARRCWYIATTRIKDRLLEENASVDWRPAHIRDGRYGEWLAGNVDWALSRERYWGTPLPIWRCADCHATEAVGSLAELGARAGADLAGLDPHRPSVDEVGMPCQACGGTMRRVPEVIDAWFDSGAMPFAQFGYPHVPGSCERFAELFPADLVCEAIDQTRGWFYSLEAVSTLLFDRNSYRRALCLGLMVDAEGRKMSTSTGNVIDPWTLIDTYGTDALRWLLLVEGSPWQSRRIGEGQLTEVTRKLILTLWNTYYFFVAYAGLEGWTPERVAPPVEGRPVMDRWVLAELAEVSAEADAALADFDAPRAGKRLAAFVDDLSNWYVRRSRERFWNADPEAGRDDTDAAFTTLHTCLSTLARLLAPFTPFLADELHENLVRLVAGEAPESVHLTEYPVPDETARDEALREAMALARRLVTLGRDARTAAGVPVRQPLRRAVVTAPAEVRHLLAPVQKVIAAELNVKAIELASGEAATMSHALRPNFRALGPMFGQRTPAVAAAIQRADAEAAVADLRDRGAFSIDLEGETIEVTGELVQVIEEPLTGWQVSADGPYSVALDLEVDRELRLEGTARELVRVVNDLRKRRGLDLADRIALHLEIAEDPEGEIAATLDAHRDAIARDVLAHSVVRRGVDASRGTLAERVRVGEGQLLVDLRTVDESGSNRDSHPDGSS